MPRANDARRLHSRRIFLIHAAGACAAGAAVAQAARVDELSPQAVALGYVHDTARADKKRFPKHTPAQVCANCALYQGKPADAWGGCPLFGARLVAGPGWCSAWAKR